MFSQQPPMNPTSGMPLQGMGAPMAPAMQPLPQIQPIPPKSVKREVPPPKVDVAQWLKSISDYENAFRSWNNRVEKIIDRYRDDKKEYQTDNPAKFNILWSNVQTAVPATFSRLPKPDVSRRHSDNDPVGRVAALIIERGLEYEIEHCQDYRAAMKNSVFDRFMGGRGISWVRYEPHFKAADAKVGQVGAMITEDADETEESPEAQEELDYEYSPVDYVHWKDFGHTVARTWEEVTGVWRRVYMSRPALVKRFGEELGNKIPLDTRPDDDKKSTRDDEKFQAAVYEIWDKESDAAIWISKSHTETLDVRHDPLELESFFPCPRPLYATITTDSLIPVPDFTMYQDQAYALDGLAATIDGLVQALKIRGIHDAAIPELARLFKEAGNGDLIPVHNWNAFAEKQGLKGALEIVDLTPIGNALVSAYAAVEHIKAEIYEITGLSDIIRGSSDPRETAEAVKTKGQFGSMRLRSMQNDVVQYATEILQIKAHIMCTQYSDSTLIGISGVEQLSQEDQQYIPQALQLIRNNPLRGFRIEVSSDSMIQMDEAQEKVDRIEFMAASGKYLQGMLALSQSPVSAEIMPLAVDMLKFGITGFKVGKTLEGQFDALGDSLRKAAAQKAANPQPVPPPPQVQVAQMKLQADSQKFQAENAFEMQKMQQGAAIEQQSNARSLQIEQQRMAMEAQAEQTRQQNEMAVEQHRQQVQAQQNAHQQQLEAEREQLKQQYEERLESQKMQQEERIANMEQQFQLLMARLDHANKIEVAEISKTTTLESAQISAANAGSQDDSVI